MSIAITSMVWQRSKAKGPARLVLLALADHADEEGRAWPSAARLDDVDRRRRSELTSGNLR